MKKLLFLPIIVFMLGILALSPLSAAASQYVKHDLSHPVYLVYAGARSGDGLTIGSTKSNLTPLAGWPNGCYNNVAYKQTENGTDHWTQYSGGGHIKSIVWYYWCPKYAGDPWGQNFSYGEAHPVNACVDFEVGYSPGVFWYGGGALFDANKNLQATDGEYHTTYNNICSSNNNYVWDYSTPLPGGSGGTAYHYYAVMGGAGQVHGGAYEEGDAWSPFAQ